MECSMSGAVFHDTADGIWDDGEWVSWNWINGQLHDQELRKEFPEADIEIVRVFEDLVASASNYKALTGRYLQIWGELGELYAELKFGIRRHAPRSQGSDGRMGNDLVEVKTISPEKGNQRVEVKRAGNFNKLLIVRIDADFNFEAKMIDRRALGKGSGKLAKVSWIRDEDC
jgi:hypothetical protein